MIWRTLLFIPALFSIAWGALALFYQLQLSGWARWAIIVIWCVINGFLLWEWWRKGAGWQLLCVVLLLLMLGAWWSTIKASNHRDWAEDVNRLTTAEVNGTHVILHNVRNFDWINRDKANARWETRQYDIDQIQSVDVFLSYWMGPAIAHTLVSFGFSNGEQVVWSVEIRREKHESFSSVGGFFKKFEMSVVAADENDIVRLRTNARGEDVYRYKVNMDLPAARSLFLAYADTANEVAAEPRFYHTVIANCTTIIYELVTRIIPGLPKDYRLLLSGYLPEYLYGIKALDNSESLAQLRQQAAITERAKKIPENVDFSQYIRQAPN
ncbi:DUF4105 domain-containing protein [Paenalcaligenes niemegkensis]|uniref:Lnb N-terminal periplasmic domain-containing protein n=1 Tax=Paenalcaligenes niemegkensis TaxID=2895469 RepID=UPI001EE7CDB7|nr:DUF4105 domain-containing protein [Paenalcaligenes niemegkensis]MCQ9617842.1 DUF4105 domain-containing protein [Paenalcaligenes niemegkensis]